MQRKQLYVLTAVLAFVLLSLILVCVWMELQGRVSPPNMSQNSEPSNSEDSSPTQQTSAAESTQMPTEGSQPEQTQPSETIWIEPADIEFVRIADYIPDTVIDLKYATTDNFTQQVIYDFSDSWLRYGTVKKLMQVQQELQTQGLRLKIWDAFRPPAAQFKLWSICPDPTYVSDPNKGFSSHSRGNTVDITLVYADGREVEMPTGFDDFTTKADRDYSDCTTEAATNAKLLEELMQRCGFKLYYGEWWHYTDTTNYDVEMEFLQ